MRVLLVLGYVLGVLWALTVVIMIGITVTLGYTITDHFHRPAIWGLILSASGGLLAMRYQLAGGGIVLLGCLLMAIEDPKTQILVPLAIGMLYLYCGWRVHPEKTIPD